MIYEQYGRNFIRMEQCWESPAGSRSGVADRSGVLLRDDIPKPATGEVASRESRISGANFTAVFAGFLRRSERCPGSPAGRLPVRRLVNLTVPRQVASEFHSKVCKVWHTQWQTYE